MLGSCSKDDTEVAPVEVKGKVAFSAVLPVGGENETRTHLNEKGQYVWDDGDMLGASVMGGTEVVPFVADPNAEAGQTRVDFLVVDNDLDYLGAGPYYVAYPYDKTVAVAGSADAPTMKMTIPASQRYRANSFATMTAPAVGVVQGDPEKDGYYNPGVSEVTLHAACSYIRIPVKGAGSLTELKLQIQKASSSDLYVLNGAGDVAFAEGDNQYVLDLNGVGSTATAENNYVKISFGAKGLDLKYVEEVNLLFVVPAHIPLRGSVIKYEAIVDGKSQTGAYNAIPDDYTEKLPRNMILPMPAIELGMEDKVLIENNADLLEYLYTVSKGTDGDKTAVLVNDINFSRYDARNDINGAEGNMLAALTEYLTNGSAINSIAEGAKIDGNGHIISNLQVSGNGIFAGKPDALKNLTLSAVTVNVPDGQKTPALFAGVLPGATAVSNVKFAGGYLKNVAEGVVPAMVASANATILPTADQIKISSYPRVNETTASAYYAATLYVNGDIVADDADKKVYFGTTSRFAVIKGTKAGAVISRVSAGKAVENIIAAVDPKSAQAFSVIDTRSTSYWTGLVAAAGDGKVNTAEELAYYVKNGGTATLAANIDLQGNLQGKQGKEWVLDNGSAPLNITGNGKYTISNALVKSQKVTEPYVAYSLLGNVVNAKDIVVDGVTIDVDNVEGSTAQLYVGGIGYQGSANGVKVSNLTIDIAEDVKVSTYNEVGGLISAPTAASEKNAVTDLSINVNGNETVGLVGGMFAKAPESFNENSLAYKAEAADKYAMIAAWTLSNDAKVASCAVADNAAPVVDVITVNAGQNGQTLLLDYDKECSEPFYGKLINPNDYLTTVKINGENVDVKPAE